MALENAYKGFHFTSFNLEKIKADLDLARVQNQTIAMSEQIHYVIETATVAGFPLPIIHDGIVYVDARPFTKLDREGKLQIRDVLEHDLRLDEARWELVWTNPAVNRQSLMSQFPYYHEIFSTWVADAISHTYGLTPYQSSQIKALAALFSIGHFYNGAPDELTAYRLQEMVGKELYLPMQIFESVSGRTEFFIPRDVEEFVQMVVAADVTPRLKDFNVSALLQNLSGAFFGISFAKQLTSSAVEYPPSLLVIMKACLENSTYNRTRLGQVVKRSKVTKQHDKFVRSYEITLNEHTKPPVDFKEF